MHMKATSLRHNQTGIVSITVTLLFILIISIITTSFAFLMRREQRQALDRQLSTQAFYTAESGVNDAVAAINSGTLSAIDNCDNQTRPASLPNELDGETFQYTCLLVDEAPSSLTFDDIGVDESTVIKLTPASGTIRSIKISWQATGEYKSSNPNTIFATNNNYDLPTGGLAANSTSFAHHTGILRATVIRVPSLNLNRTTLTNNSQTLFLYPKAANNPGASGSTGFRDSSQSREGIFVDGDCNTGNAPRRFCSATITNINQNNVYLRLSSIYKASSVEIEAFEADNQKLELVDAQYVVDVTGRANDVLRRIQVRVPRKQQYYYPEFALESAESICKRMFVFNNYVTEDASEPACNLNKNDTAD